jgi:hypothetical protein
MPTSPIPDDYTQRPPPGFDPEWAKFVLQFHAATKTRQPLLANVGTFVAVASSLIALVVSFVNAVNLSQDRKDQSRKAALESQVSLAKLYFDKLPSTNVCDSRTDKLLFAKTAVTIAGLSFSQMVAEFRPNQDMTPSLNVDDEHRELQGLARVLFADIYTHMRDCGDGELKVAATATPAAPVQVAAPIEGSTYGLREQAQAPIQATLTSSKLTAYIQYKKGDQAALERAKALQAILKAKGINAPGTEGVSSVPKSDQLRIYKRDDEKAATMLKTTGEFHLADAQIIDLSRAYPNLPAGIIEIWLGSPG